MATVESRPSIGNSFSSQKNTALAASTNSFFHLFEKPSIATKVDIFTTQKQLFDTAANDVGTQNLLKKGSVDVMRRTLVGRMQGSQASYIRP